MAMWGGGTARRSGIDADVLAELRAIREEIHTLAERVSQAASRDDLKLYVTQQQFDDHLATEREKTLDDKGDWRWWAAFSLSIFAVVVAFASAHIGIVIR